MKLNNNIQRIGNDNAIHFCEPHSNLTLCGVKIVDKKIKPIDYINHYHCIECDYTNDDMVYVKETVKNG